MYAASFDCAKAKRPVEVAICSDAALSAADTRMAATYRTDLSRLSSNSVGLLRVDQVQWLAYAQLVCDVNLPTTTKAAAAACLKPLYDERIKQLRGAVAVRDGVTFLKRTQFLAAVEPAGDPAPSAEHAGFGTLQAEWPAADSDADEWIRWSAAIEARMLKTAGAGQEQELRDGKKRTLPKTWDDAMAVATDTQISAVLKGAEHGRVTTIISTEGMGHGAAHAFESSETVTWLLAEKRALRAADVFAAADWKHPLGVLCWKDLHARDAKEKMLYDEVTGPDAKPLQEVIADVTNWTLEPDGLHISYPEYAVAPRVSAVEDTVLAWSALKPLLQKNFVQP